MDHTWIIPGRPGVRRPRRVIVIHDPIFNTLTEGRRLLAKISRYMNPSIHPFNTTASSAIKGTIQLGIGYTVGNLTSKPDRDVLMQDFYVVESVFLPRAQLMTN
ncbi:unnamed protein product [Ranitomeya imitator]|uniref:Uncharacterized protein n=1 Tax=Ranitomeya imitator TaxID=111125 RepID=A0ABN9LII9_9NEOB|nr:unnamed protein product [Ranitomeya imitator]